jgi:hypothetical protein
MMVIFLRAVVHHSVFNSVFNLTLGIGDLQLDLTFYRSGYGRIKT